MTSDLNRLTITAKSGRESFCSEGKELGYTLLDFWRWSVSDLVSNATRGRLAEFIVARAIGISTDGVRDEWGAFDLVTPSGTKIEVKAAAYIQSWHQDALSTIVFRTPKTHAWNADTNIQSKESKRQADVYVFALLAHKDKATVNPLNIDQWRFYVLPTSVLDSRERNQQSITLKTLESLAGSSVEYTDLALALKRAVKQTQ